MRVRIHGDIVAPLEINAPAPEPDISGAGSFGTDGGLRGAVERLGLETLAPTDAPPGDAAPAATNKFRRLYPNLPAGDYLPAGLGTIEALKTLGLAMAADPGTADTAIPAAFTYFGQFIDHDITVTSPVAGHEGRLDLTGNVTPLTDAEIAMVVVNGRQPTLDLDSVYTGDPIPPRLSDGRMQVGHVSGVGPRVALAPGSAAFKDSANDLPRLPLILEPTPDKEKADRAALIGDARNDENVIVAQLHVALLRAHNALVAELGDADKAQSALRRMYQGAVLRDFLPRVCDPAIVAAIAGGDRRLPLTPDALFMPLEFAVAAYRFGHSMVRGGYRHNDVLPGLPFNTFFMFTALSGSLVFQPSEQPDPLTEPPSLPQNWVIQWEWWIGRTQPINVARAIDPQITPALGRLPGFDGSVPGEPGQPSIPALMASLAKRNLLRGYLFNLPTGQAVAREVGETVLSPAELVSGATSDALKAALSDPAFANGTPLWYYILAEAQITRRGQSLGPTGSRLVAETLFTLADATPDSITTRAPAQDEEAGFSLEEILKLSGNLQ
jgi:hypothetical protein